MPLKDSSNKDYFTVESLVIIQFIKVNGLNPSLPLDVCECRFLTLRMTTAKVDESSFNINSNSHYQDSTQLDDP